VSAGAGPRRVARIALWVAGVAAALVIGFFILLYFTFERRPATDEAVRAAINAPGGGDYAKAAAIVAASPQTEDAKAFAIGQLVVDAHGRPGARRPPGTLADGLHAIERAAETPGPTQAAAQAQLRQYFARGVGTGADGLPADAAVAACWAAVTGRTGTPAGCVALRRARLPRLSAG